VSISVRVVGPEGVDPGAQLHELTGPQRDRLILAVFRRRVALIKKAAAAELVRHGVARRIWGRDEHGAGGSRGGAGDAMKQIKSRVGVRDGNYTAEVSEKGLPAMMELGGGRTQPHIIKPKFAKRLAFVSSGGLRYVSGPVSHPGGPVPKAEHLWPEIQREDPDLQREVRAAMDGFVERVTSRGNR
jgi:hypothetical protein